MLSVKQGLVLLLALVFNPCEEVTGLSYLLVAAGFVYWILRISCRRTNVTYSPTSIDADKWNQLCLGQWDTTQFYNDMHNMDDFQQDKLPAALVDVISSYLFIPYQPMMTIQRSSVSPWYDATYWYKDRPAYPRIIYHSASPEYDHFKTRKPNFACLVLANARNHNRQSNGPLCHQGVLTENQLFSTAASPQRWQMSQLRFDDRVTVFSTVFTSPYEHHYGIYQIPNSTAIRSAREHSTNIAARAAVVTGLQQSVKFCWFHDRLYMVHANVATDGTYHVIFIQNQELTRWFTGPFESPVSLQTSSNNASAVKYDDSEAVAQEHSELKYEQDPYKSRSSSFPSSGWTEVFRVKFSASQRMHMDFSICACNNKLWLLSAGHIFELIGPHPNKGGDGAIWYGKCRYQKAPSGYYHCRYGQAYTLENRYLVYEWSLDTGRSDSMISQRRYLILDTVHNELLKFSQPPMTSSAVNRGEYTQRWIQVVHDGQGVAHFLLHYYYWDHSKTGHKDAVIFTVLSADNETCRNRTKDIVWYPSMFYNRIIEELCPVGEPESTSAASTSSSGNQMFTNISIIPRHM